MQIPLVDLKAEYRSIQTAIDAAMRRVVENTSFILGKEVEDFETAFAQYVGTRCAVGVASGTAALILALRACGIGPGDEVITSAHTFMATAEAISQCGADPVFVDIDPKTYNVDPNRVAEAVTARTKALLPVHLYGHPADMAELEDIASGHGLSLIEDAAQAHGAEYRGRRCGSIGRLGCFSFYPGKNLGAYGDAGAVTGNDADLLEVVRTLRDHGRTTKYEHQEVGLGERLDALQAAILAAKLPNLEAWTEARRAHARAYNDRLADSDVVTPYESPEVRHVYHQYVVRAARRDEVVAQLKSEGIGAGIHYPIPLHRQPAYLKRGYDRVSLPETEKAAGEVLSLPVYPTLTDEQIDYVVDVLNKAVGS